MAWWFWPFGRRRNTVPVVEMAAEPPPAPPPTPEPARLPDLWQVLGASVRGASHERADLPNQDAIDWRPPSGTGRWVLLAVADGHGSAKSFRSEVGSRLAVETALAAMQELVDGQTDPPDLSACKRAVDEDVPVAIERRWKAAVAAHLEENPLLVKEVARVEESQGPVARQAVEQDPVQAYGTTLITVLLHESFLACLQLGDGDVLIVAADGEVVRPLQDDPRLMANRDHLAVRPRLLAGFPDLLSGADQGPAGLGACFDGRLRQLVQHAAGLPRRGHGPSGDLAGRGDQEPGTRAYRSGSKRLRGREAAMT